MGILNKFFKQPEEEKIDVDDDLKAIITFLKELNTDTKNILGLCKDMQEKRKKPLLDQVKSWHKVLKQYELFEEDADINGVRVKKIAKALRDKANEELKDEKWKKKINSDERWTFNW